MKRYGLLKCFPLNYYQGGNECIAECHANSITDAIPQLQPQCSVKLDNSGYAKAGEVSFVIGEFFG
jgi:hypothetical protein